MTNPAHPIDDDRRYKLIENVSSKPVTLNQCFEWAQRNHDASYPVVTRLIEEIEELRALLNDVNNDLQPGYFVSYQAMQNVRAYFSELDRS